MDTKKLDKWAELLLDTGKRNNLINFKDSKTSSVEVLLPEPHILFEKLDAGSSLEVFETPAEDNVRPEEPEEKADDREEYKAKYSPKLKKQNQLLIYNKGGDPNAALKNIDKKADEYIEETGVNVAHMAFGMICWREKENAEDPYKAPLLLIPIYIERKKSNEPYTITSSGDDVTVNPTFAYKLEAEHGIKLPEYEEQGLKEYLNIVREQLALLKWQVTDECRIGIFSFLKVNMYRDLKDNGNIILSNPNVRMLLGEKDAFEQGNTPTAARTHNPLMELHNVVDADSSQIEAIETARTGVSFVLQGPPGTGKSQTITNMIAELLNSGKKVLFVSEKSAALNVVYDKLKQAGLSEFCLELHSHKANKKAVIKELCDTLRMSKSAVSDKADAELTAKEKAQKQLDSYAAELHRTRENIGKSLYRLYEDYSAVRNAHDIGCFIPDINDKNGEYFEECIGLIEEYSEYVPSIGVDHRKNSWYGYINPDNSHQAKNQVKTDLDASIKYLSALSALQERIERRYGVYCLNVEQTRLWRKFFGYGAEGTVLTPRLLNINELEKAQSNIKKAEKLCKEILTAKEEIGSEFDGDIYRLDGSDCLKRLTKQFDGGFSRLFSKEYKGIVSDLRLSRKSGKKPSYEEAVKYARILSEYQKKQGELSEAESLLKGVVGSALKGTESDWENINGQTDFLRSLLQTGFYFGRLETMTNEEFERERTEFSALCQETDDCFKLRGEEYSRLSSYFDPEVFDPDRADTQAALMKCKTCMSGMYRLDNWCRFRGILKEIGQRELMPFVYAAMEENIPAADIPLAYKKRLYSAQIDAILAQEPVLASFSRISQDRAAELFKKKDVLHFEINKAKIRAALSSRRPSPDMVSSGSAVSVLLREAEKKRRQKSIRALLTEAGELIQVIKPCFLMSPLSVSTFLTSRNIHFDTVIFDEASQIFPQDAAGAIYRADQLIVVGDSKQMPPGNFFNASLEAEDDEETGDVTDFESVLDLCSASMRQLRLNWHYRSRFEQLIAFSNKNFYDGSLITFPSASCDREGTGVDYHYVNGIFDRKSHTNRAEAEYITELVYKNIEEYPDRSLGVVAFSASQQNLIDKLLWERRLNNPDKEFFFAKDREEPFFVKNLETVQGDERDTIIFSVAYGFDESGKLLHNFGPLNRAGGERRLNVAVTRAKHNVQLVSSMHHTDIDLTRTGAEGARLLKEYLDFAENGDIALLQSFDSNHRNDRFNSAFEAEVAEFLRDNGFDINTQVGCSGFKIDIGLKKPDSADYVLAIECDGASYRSAKNARDRDRLRQQVLEKMGWRFCRVWSTDWYCNNAAERQRLLETAEKAINTPMRYNEQSENVYGEDNGQNQEDFEEEKREHFEFPPYKAADTDMLIPIYRPNYFKAMVKEILETEAPLSEELLLKRVLPFFRREKVTVSVQNMYEIEMKDCGEYGIIRRNGFLYYQGNNIHFRAAGDIVREVKHICPEELAAGILGILKQNITADKTGLYNELARQCGISRAGSTVTDLFDKALELLGDKVTVEGEMLKLK
ncbi:MAG: DUF4011 domain-containing protein [Ruminococcaceae bacterium]|nr:DUF4011 domain-containing protein [Oscillospiraceae bacterium]